MPPSAHLTSDGTKMTIRIFPLVLLCLTALSRLAAAQSPPDIRLPLPGKSAERQLGADEIHRYRFVLKKGEFFQIRVDQKGVDLTLQLRDARDRLIAAADRPNDKNGPEVLTFVAPLAAAYVLEARSVDPKASPGSYTIAREPLRQANDVDRKRIALERAFSAAIAASNLAGQEAVTLAKLQEILRGWQDLNDTELIRATEVQIRQLRDEAIKRADRMMDGSYRLYKKGDRASLEQLIDRNSQARRLFRELGAKEKEAQALNGLALAYSALGDSLKAIELFTDALAILPQDNNEGMGILLDGLGKAYADIGESRKALDCYTRALPLKRETRSKNSEANTLNSMGEALFELGETNEAIKKYDEALAIVDGITDKRGKDLILFNLGNAYGRLSSGKKALEFYEKAIAVYIDAKDKKGEGSATARIGLTYSLLGDTSKAIQYYKRAQELMSESGDEHGLALVDNNFGALYVSLDEKRSSIEYYEKALGRAQRIDDQFVYALTQNNLGQLYNNLGQNEKALDSYTKALAASRKAFNKSLEATTLRNIGVLYSSLGDHQSAVENYQKAADLRAVVGDKKGEAIALNNMGLALAMLHQDRKARESYERALLLDKEIEPLALLNIGMIHTGSGEYEKALTYFNRALTLFRSAGNRSLEATTLNNIGMARLSLGEKQAAVDCFYQALQVFRAVDDRRGESFALGNLMTAWEMLGNRRSAVLYGKRAVANLQSLRSDIKGIDTTLQLSFLGSVEGIYRKLCEVLLADGRLEEAQQALNLFKDQEYFDSDPFARRQFVPLTLTSHERDLDSLYQQTIEKRSLIGDRLAELRRDLADHEPTPDEAARLQQLEADRGKASEEFTSVLKRAESDLSSPGAETDTVGKISDTAEMQSVLRDLQKQTGQSAAAIYTLIGEDNFRSLIVTPDKILATSYPAKGSELRQRIIKYYGALSEKDKLTSGPASSDEEVQKEGKELYEIIFSGIRTKLDTLGSQPAVLMWSLDGPLRYLPVSALYDGKQYLAERYQNVVFTRANSARALSPVSSVWTGSGFYNSKEYSLPIKDPADGKLKLVGFDSLKDAKAEAEAIFGVSPRPGLIGGELLSNNQFTRASFFAALRRDRPLVHIASHFRFEAGDANASFLLLGDGNKLTLEDIKAAPDDLFSGVQLLTLSACETGVQKKRESDGREIDGFAELAQRKGAQAVIASLWKVDDESTSQLMTEFYRSRQMQKITKSAALQKAQIGLIKTRGFSHPFYWSPFVLIGNWR